MNKDLYGKIYTIPPLILSGIQNAIKAYPSDEEGIKRAKTLLSGTVNYNQLKRILHDMKKFSKNNEIGKYVLAGGEPFETWGWTTLNGDRGAIEFNKKMKKDSDSIGGIEGRTNAYLKKHTKSKNPTKPARTNMTPNSKPNFASTLKLGKLFEEVERIKELMI